jgi:hypothetical protein
MFFKYCKCNMLITKKNQEHLTAHEQDKLSATDRQGSVLEKALVLISLKQNFIDKWL